jgi:hypothetical protein
MTSPAPDTTAPRLPIPAARQMTIRVNQWGQEAAMVLGFVAPGAVTTAQAQAQLQSIWNVLRVAMSNSVTCTGAVLRDVSGDENGALELAAPTNSAGAFNGRSAVAAAGTLVKWGSTNGSRSGKGRTFIPALPEANIADNSRSLRVPEHVTPLQNALNTYLGATTTTQPLYPAVLSFSRGVAYPITSAAVGPIAAMQRRRMR